MAVAGNPNVGKSTLFNVLTGETARVGNWPGVTVERKEGVRVYKNKKFCFVDLPGTYGISATSLEEIVAREYIISGEPNVVLVLVDGTAPERTLYLPIQILELMPNVVIAVTKADMTHKMGIHIHIDKLEARLGVPVVEVSAIQGSGIRELLEAILAVAGKKRGREKPLRIDYGGLEPIISEVEKITDTVSIMLKGRIIFTGELDEAKEKFKCVTVPSHVKVEDLDVILLKSTREEKIVVVKGEETIEKIMERAQGEVKVENMNLEDIFMAFVRGGVKDDNQ